MLSYELQIVFVTQHSKFRTMKIEISNLKKAFGDNIVLDINQFNIGNGEIIGLAGNNGAGKTTLFRSILDLIKYDEGIIRMYPAVTPGNEETVIDPASSEDWKGITGAYIDEGFLIDFLTPEEYFYFIGKVNGIKKDETDMRLKDFEPFMGGEILGQKKLIRNLSAGNKQKVGIISAMLHKPQLIILDEPFNFLDPTSQNQLKKLLVKYNAETGATILISSHNLSHTEDISTRIALLEHGVIIKDLDNKEGAANKELESYFNID